MELKDARILVTGGTRGLGRQFALDLAQAGARVGVCAVQQDAMKTLEEDFEREGLSLWARRADVADPEQVQQLFADFVQDHGGIEAVINNAGVIRDGLLVKKNPDGSLCRLSLEDWNRVIAVNLTGVFLCGREAASHMIQRDTPGAIVNISSVCRAGNIGQTAYSAAKAGIVAMSVSWAKELARYRIRVASVAPGYVATQMTDTIRPDVRQKIESSIPAGRMATCAEVSHTVRFVLENEYLTGRVIELDGGLRV